MTATGHPGASNFFTLVTQFLAYLLFSEFFLQLSHATGVLVTPISQLGMAPVRCSVNACGINEWIYFKETRMGKQSFQGRIFPVCPITQDQPWARGLSSSHIEAKGAIAFLTGRFNGNLMHT
jgi:hypothetical protein